MPRYRLSIDVPRWVDNLIVWPVLLWRWLWYEHAYRRVKLLPDKYAKVDAKDFHKISKYTWWVKKTPRSFTAVRFKAKGRLLVQVYMHREIMLRKLKPESGELPEGLFVDHIDRDSLNNLRSNLRLATMSQNSMNRRKIRGASSKYKGVTWNRSMRLWQGCIYNNKKSIHLGYYESEVEAAKAYDEAARRYHGEFAYQNFGDDNRPKTRREKIKSFILRLLHG